MSLDRKEGTLKNGLNKKVQMSALSHSAMYCFIIMTSAVLLIKTDRNVIQDINKILHYHQKIPTFKFHTFSNKYHSYIETVFRDLTYLIEIENFISKNAIENA